VKDAGSLSGIEAAIPRGMEAALWTDAVVWDKDRLLVAMLRARGARPCVASLRLMPG
jgi:hypothetical protein